MKAITVVITAAVSFSIHAATLPRQWQIADEPLADYFRRETRALSDKCLSGISTGDEWRKRAPELREQFAEMLGLSPLPARTDLKATVTGRFEHDTFTVEKLHFQSRPGLYVTANLYVPKNLTKPAPTILYVCGHAPVVTNGVSYGTKAAYQHHGIWFARNGYVCLMIDTLESGEILGEHHGTHRAGMWWWNSRGYTPAGVETWNGMRALDYLSTRPEVDTNRVGITGRSGGGAYSWFVTAMDDRIKAAAPVAGITDLENHVVDGAVEGHCDCMFFVNTYRWDYAQLAALAAPRPLLLCNTDSDNIFPLDGVVRIRNKVQRVYELLGAAEKFGLVITPGPHKDTQELQVPVMRWFNRHLKGEETLIENAAVKLFSPQQLKVFETLPPDSLNGKIHETFVSVSKPAVPPTDKAVWNTLGPPWRDELRAKVFAGRVEQIVDAVETEKIRSWDSTVGQRGPFRMVPAKGLVPAHVEPIEGKEKDSRVHARPIEEFLEFTGFHTNGGFVTGPISIGNMRGTFARPVGTPPSRVVLRIAKASGVSAPVMPEDQSLVIQVGLADFSDRADAKKEVQLRRRYMLLGETIHSASSTDIIALLLQIRADKTHRTLPLRLEAEGNMAVNALYASLFAPVDELVLTHLPKSHMNGPDYLNVLRILDVPQAVAMASERARVELRGANEADWQYAVQTARNLGWEKNLRIIADAAAR